MRDWRNIQRRERIVPTTKVWVPEMLKFSLVAMFVLSLATLSVAASALPVPV